MFTEVNVMFEKDIEKIMYHKHLIFACLWKFSQLDTSSLNKCNFGGVFHLLWLLICFYLP